MFTNGRIIKNIVYNGAVQISGIVLNLILLPYIARVLGKEALGINSFGQAIAGYFVLIGNLGITIYGAKAIAERRDKPIDKQQKFAECITYQFFFNILAVFLYNGWVLIHGENIYFLFNIIILTSMTDLSWAYTGMERFDLIAARNLIIKVVGTLSIFLFVKDVSNLFIFILIQQGILLISNIVFWFELSKIDLSPRFTSLSKSLKNVLKPALVLFIPSVFTSIYLSLNKVMLGYLSTIGEVAIYDYPNRLIRIAITFIGILGTVMMPRLAYLYHNNKQQEYINKARLLFVCSLMCSIPLFFLMELISTPLCNLFFTESFKGADIVIRIVSPTLITSGLSLYVIFVSMDKMRDFLKSVIVVSFINFVLNFLLMPTYGAKGASISLLVTETLVHIFLLYYLRNLYPLKWLIPFVIKITIVCVLICWVIIKLLGPIVSLNDMILSCGIFLFLYAVYFVLFFKNNFFSLLKSK